MVIAAVAGILLWGANPESKLGRTLIYLLVLECMSVGVTVIHEFAHAFVGRWVGFEVNGIAIGWWGRILFRRKLFGFDTIIRSLPFGGVAHVLPTTEKWMRTKDFLVVLAGPTSNLVLASLFWYPGVWGDLINVRLESLGVRGLFVAANLFVLVDLIPAVYSAPWGRTPSDGLALMQLIVLRRMPYPPLQRKTPVNIWHQVMRWTLIIVCGLGCLASFALTIAVMRDGWQSRRAMMGVTAIFGSIAAALGWFTIRAWRERVPRAASVHTLGVEGAFQQEIAQLSGLTTDAALRELAIKLQKLEAEKRGAEIQGLLSTARAERPDNVWLQLYEAGYLRNCGRLSEAAEAFRSVQRRNGLTSPTHTALLTEELRIRVLVGQDAEVRERCEEFLAQSNSVTEKVHLLDVLACLPIYEGLTSYLEQAEKWCAEALSLLPNSLTLKGTMGALLCERGEYEGGARLLEEVVKNSPADIDQAVGSFYLGLIAKLKGDSKLARKFGRKAKNACVIPALLRRIEEELAV
jgi:tetratricopeptide (TPR) repeat protein